MTVHSDMVITVLVTLRTADGDGDSPRGDGGDVTRVLVMTVMMMMEMPTFSL